MATFGVGSLNQCMQPRVPFSYTPKNVLLYIRWANKKKELVNEKTIMINRPNLAIEHANNRNGLFNAERRIYAQQDVNSRIKICMILCILAFSRYYILNSRAGICLKKYEAKTGLMNPPRY